MRVGGLHGPPPSSPSSTGGAGKHQTTHYPLETETIMLDRSVKSFAWAILAIGIFSTVGHIADFAHEVEDKASNSISYNFDRAIQGESSSFDNFK
jgi:hypothetical protein